MQLFITDFQQDWNQIFIGENRVVHQLSNVLRSKIWTIFFVQKWIDNEVQRLKVKILTIKKEEIRAEILEEVINKIEDISFGMIICLPNKFEKLELIVQKLTEIGIPKIVLRPSQRSVLKIISEAKLERLEKIKIEASEQSRSYILPQIIILQENEIKTFIQDKNILIFDASGKQSLNSTLNKENLYWLVWPEGWFDAKDLDIINNKVIEKINLWENILRTETWAIVWWWLLKNI